MSRIARQIAESGFYHVIFRGNGKQLLFEDDVDRSCFLQLLRDKASENDVAIIAWCLMSNHAHLLLDDPSQKLSHSMHALATAYAKRYNEKTGHVGAVFQGRFASIPISNECQMLQAVRYIHENPAKAGISSVDAYPWSSYREYVGVSCIADTRRVLDMVGGREGFKHFCRDGATDCIIRERCVKFQMRRRQRRLVARSAIMTPHSSNRLHARSVMERCGF